MGKTNNLLLIRDILFRPRRFFNELASNPPGLQSFLFSYGVPLMTLGAAGRMVRVMNHFGRGEDVLRGDQLAGIFMISLVAYMFAVWAGGIFLARLATAFRGEYHKERAIILAVSTLTPFMLAQAIAAIHPVLTVVSVAGIVYSLLLLAKGSNPVLGIPAQRTIGFTMVGFFILFGIAYIIILLFSALLIFDPF